MRLLFFLLVAALAALPVAAEEPLSRIAFGSCANQNREQPVWEAINKTKPQLFIFMGDNVYADTAEPAEFRASYDKLSAIPAFAKLRASCPIIATWDDHDYGKNDAGAEWEGKHAAKTAFMDFFRTPQDSPLRSRDGVHDSYVYGPDGKRVQVILLDTRWFRGPLERLDDADHRKLKAERGNWNGPYVPAKASDSTMLGEEQWKWLEAQLKIPAEIRIIVSSIQVISDENGWEKWGNLPRERKRLLDLVRDNATGVIFLSGDRHVADISMLPPETDGGPFYPVYDVTTSGLNQNGHSKEPNRFRVGTEFPFGKSNFGLIKIDWKAEDPVIRLEVLDTAAEVVREAKTTLGTLKPCTR
ncbi:MAG: alkaline phosphatase family protein [Chthoniobacterales bacterium]|nr:alkaline phosphatase family protein [Chthoniobacterales bacterium]